MIEIQIMQAEMSTSMRGSACAANLHSSPICGSVFGARSSRGWKPSVLLQAHADQKGGIWISYFAVSVLLTLQ